MDNTYSIPQHIRDDLRAMGYTPDDGMQPYVARWWEWYTSTARWYDEQRVVEAHGRKVLVQRHRLTVHPCRTVCRDWAGLLLNDTTSVTVDDPAADDALQAWLADTGLLYTGQDDVELAFATGTGAWVLSFVVRDDGAAEVGVEGYDARCILPLSWRRRTCTECAFVSRIAEHGKPLDQLQAHVLRDGTYHVVTRTYDAESGKQVHVDGIIADYDTGVAEPTFALIRPAVGNAYRDMTCMGQSVFADAIGAAQLVDNSFDSINREIDATKVKTIMSESLFDYAQDANGGTLTRPMSPDDYTVEVSSLENDLIKVVAPEIRITPLRDALDTALEELGYLCGLGMQYLRLTPGSGMRTATEVASEQSDLMRNVRKHENALSDTLARLCRAALACMGYAGVGISVSFDDSIIADTMTEKQQMLSEVSAGVVPAYRYLMRFYGMNENEAREAAGESAYVTDLPGTMG